MKIKLLKFLLPIIPFFFLTAFIPGDKEQQKDGVLLNLIFENINSTHFKPLNIDDDYSQKAFKLFLKRMDVNKRFFTQEDLDKLKKYEFRIDDQIKDDSYEFFDLANDLFNKRIKEIESFYQGFFTQAFNFSVNESIQSDADKREYSKDKNAFKEEWRKLMKYEVLNRIDEQLNIQEKAQKEKDTTVKIKTFAELEKESREKVQKRYEDYFKRIDKDTRADRLSIYINSLINVYDPHSGFFPPKDKENFDIQMSGQLEGIGAQLQETNGYIKVANIVTGSPSWKQGQLKEGDLILKVAQGKDEPVDVVDMRLEDAVRLIRGKKGTEVRLTVKKPDNSIVIIPIVRDIVIMEETFAKSVVLELPGTGQKIGYIFLPSFYADFSGVTGRRCSQDVRKEVEKLSKENIGGLIFDLRNDGGGSLQDAVDIAGLFIEKGPVVQVKARQGQPYIYEDRDPRIQYEGPLLVMVNSYSASASEIFTAAMQDYGRAVVLGTPDTYGKGTVQRFVELDPLLKQDQQDLKPLGSLKLTIQKFYRITGGSTQLKGVTPDIIFPDSYVYIERGEKENDYPMQWTQIEPVTYTKWPAPPPIDYLKEKEKVRLAKDSNFILISMNAERLKELKEKTIIQLNLEKFRADQKKIRDEAKKFDRIAKDTTAVFISSLQEDLPKIQADSTARIRATKWQKDLKKDIYLYQAALVMKDLQGRLAKK